MFSKLTCLLALAAVGRAHIALWDEGMYGWDANDPNQFEPVLPLMHLPFSQWWFHGYINKPPAAGKSMKLPAGGTYHGEVSCNKALTTHGQNDWQIIEYACDDDKAGSGTGAMHTTSKMWEAPTDNIKGCAIGIAYESDVSKIKPEDFTIISVNYTCPWKREVDFQIPADLPKCPEGGCHCMWGWVHANDAGSAQNYFVGYRCDVTGAVATRALPKAKTANKCHYPSDTANCTVGPRQPHYWYQAEQNNNNQGEYDPPFYNGDYGFMNGAQTDLFALAGPAPAPKPAPAPSPSPSPKPVEDTPPKQESKPSPDIPVVVPSSSSSSSTTTTTTTSATTLATQHLVADPTTTPIPAPTTPLPPPPPPPPSASSSFSAEASKGTKEASHICRRRRRIIRNLASEGGLKRHLARVERRDQRQRRAQAIELHGSA